MMNVVYNQKHFQNGENETAARGKKFSLFGNNSESLEEGRRKANVLTELIGRKRRSRTTHLFLSSVNNSEKKKLANTPSSTNKCRLLSTKTSPAFDRERYEKYVVPLIRSRRKMAISNPKEKSLKSSIGPVTSLSARKRNLNSVNKENILQRSKTYTSSKADYKLKKSLNFTDVVERENELDMTEGLASLELTSSPVTGSMLTDRNCNRQKEPLEATTRSEKKSNNCGKEYDQIMKDDPKHSFHSRLPVLKRSFLSCSRINWHSETTHVKPKHSGLLRKSISSFSGNEEHASSLRNRNSIIPAIKVIHPSLSDTAENIDFHGQSPPKPILESGEITRLYHHSLLNLSRPNCHSRTNKGKISGHPLVDEPKTVTTMASRGNLSKDCGTCDASPLKNVSLQQNIGNSRCVIASTEHERIPKIDYTTKCKGTFCSVQYSEDTSDEKDHLITTDTSSSKTATNTQYSITNTHAPSSKTATSTQHSITDTRSSKTATNTQYSITDTHAPSSKTATSTQHSITDTRSSKTATNTEYSITDTHSPSSKTATSTQHSITDTRSSKTATNTEYSNTDTHAPSSKTATSTQHSITDTRSTKTATNTLYSITDTLSSSTATITQSSKFPGAVCSTSSEIPEATSLQAIKEHTDRIYSQIIKERSAAVTESEALIRFIHGQIEEETEAVMKEMSAKFQRKISALKKMMEFKIKVLNEKFGSSLQTLRSLESLQEEIIKIGNSQAVAVIRHDTAEVSQMEKRMVKTDYLFLGTPLPCRDKRLVRSMSHPSVSPSKLFPSPEMENISRSAENISPFTNLAGDFERPSVAPMTPRMRNNVIGMKCSLNQQLSLLFG